MTFSQNSVIAFCCVRGQQSPRWETRARSVLEAGCPMKVSAGLVFFSGLSPGLSDGDLAVSSCGLFSVHAGVVSVFKVFLLFQGLEFWKPRVLLFWLPLEIDNSPRQLSLSAFPLELSKQCAPLGFQTSVSQDLPREWINWTPLTSTHVPHWALVHLFLLSWNPQPYSLSLQSLCFFSG